MVGEQLAVLYRDKDPRDMALAVSEDGGVTWDRLGHVGAFGRGFDGCPHVGGGLGVTFAGSEQLLHAVVWTGKEADAGVHALSSGDGGRNWTAPQRLGSIRARTPTWPPAEPPSQSSGTRCATGSRSSSPPCRRTTVRHGVRQCCCRAASTTRCIRSSCRPRRCTSSGRNAMAMTGSAGGRRACSWGELSRFSEVLALLRSDCRSAGAGGRPEDRSQ